MNEWIDINCINCNVFLAETPLFLRFNDEVVRNRLEKPHAIYCLNCVNLIEEGII